jgi:hypothetical protein
MPAAERTAEVVDFQEYRRRRADAETTEAPPVVSWPMPFPMIWMPVFFFMPVWRVD